MITKALKQNTCNGFSVQRFSPEKRSTIWKRHCSKIQRSKFNNWAATWQNQQSDCAPSEAWVSAQSDESLRCALNGQLRTQAFFMWTAKTDQTGGCQNWAESLLGAHSICWFCHVVAQLKMRSFACFCIQQWTAPVISRFEAKSLNPGKIPCSRDVHIP